MSKSSETCSSKPLKLEGSKLLALPAKQSKHHLKVGIVQNTFMEAAAI